jgi:hypothetical protein
MVWTLPTPHILGDLDVPTSPPDVFADYAAAGEGR